MAVPGAHCCVKKKKKIYQRTEHCSHRYRVCLAVSRQEGLKLFFINGAVVTHIRCSRWDATALYLWSLCLFRHVVFPEAFAPTDLLLQGLRQFGDKAESLHLPCDD